MSNSDRECRNSTTTISNEAMLEADRKRRAEQTVVKDLGPVLDHLGRDRRAMKRRMFESDYVPALPKGDE